MARDYVVDACALLRFIADEKGADKVEHYLLEAQTNKIHLIMHITNLGEVVYWIGKKYGWEIAERKRVEIELLPIEIVPFSEALFWKAVELKSNYPMSYADCFAAALALDKQAILLTSDPEFKVLDKQLKRIEV